MPFTYETEEKRLEMRRLHHQNTAARRKVLYDTDPVYRAEKQAYARARYHQLKERYQAYRAVHGPLQREKRRRVTELAKAEQEAAARLQAQQQEDVVVAALSS